MHTGWFISPDFWIKSEVHQKDFFVIIHAFVWIMGSSLYGFLTMHLFMGCSYPASQLAANRSFSLHSCSCSSGMNAEAWTPEILFSTYFVLIIFWWYQMVKQLSLSRWGGEKTTYLWFHSTLSHHCWVEVKDFFGQELGSLGAVDISGSVTAGHPNTTSSQCLLHRVTSLGRCVQ